VVALNDRQEQISRNEWSQAQLVLPRADAPAVRRDAGAAQELRVPDHQRIVTEADQRSLSNRLHVRANLDHAPTWHIAVQQDCAGHSAVLGLWMDGMPLRCMSAQASGMVPPASRYASK